VALVSASEKLNNLRGAASKERTQNELFAALPQIVAVVKAAEVITSDLIYVGIEGPYDTPPHRLGHALAVLDEAL
jgi:hypothetical protein